MKLLIVNENPLQKLGDQYYSIYSWIKFPLFLSHQFERTTLWAPVRAAATPESLPSEAWRIDVGSLAIEPHDVYDSFLGCYRMLLRRYLSWSRKAHALVREHDLVVVRIPSPILGIIAGAAFRWRKPMVLIASGDMESQSCRIVGSRGLARLFYRSVARYIASRERGVARRAAAVYAYSQQLARKFGPAAPLVRLMRTPLLSEREILDGVDTCRGGPLRLLRVCWLQYSKGLECLLRSFAFLLAKGVDARLEIAGKERLAGYQMELERLAGSLGVRSRVHFSGWTPFDRMREVYLRNDIQVVSSFAEGTPRCIVEGAARGLPLVSTTAGGCSDFLQDRVNAILVSPEDPQALAFAVKEVGDDPVLRRRLIQGGYELARQSTTENLGKKFAEELKEIIRSHGV